MWLFVDKAWGYGDPNPDHYFLALNYRMTELQGAVALAQLDKVERRCRKPDQDGGACSPGSYPTSPAWARPNSPRTASTSTGNIPCASTTGSSRAEWTPSAARLKEKGIFSAPRYIQKPAFMCQVLKDRNTFGQSHFPYEGECRKNDPPVLYDPKEYPGTFDALAHVVVLPWNEFYNEEHVNYIAENIIETAKSLRR